MPTSGLTGSRIRERRIDLGLRQAGLAEACGISASYLNLIEHNRRRIGGKLLNTIASVLSVEPSVLSEGADVALIDALVDGAAAHPNTGAEPARAEELAGRFPGWARLLAAQSERIAGLERIVETLNDRLAHDPHLYAALHDMLSATTGIRASSAILVGDDPVDPEWQARFHRNIYEDSQRLAEAAQGLVSYLDASQESDRSTIAPQEELENWLAERGYHVADLELSPPHSVDMILGSSGVLSSGPTRGLAEAYLKSYCRDAERIPLSDLREALADMGPDPAALAVRFGSDLATVFRRLASLPADELQDGIGLTVCDASGTLVFRRPIDGFSLPRYGAACPLLPLYQALGRPMNPVRAVVELAGRTPRRFLTYSIAQPIHPAGFDEPTVFQASMLILPEPPGGSDSDAAVPIGPTCRVCPRQVCSARREPSIVGIPSAEPAL